MAGHIGTAAITSVVCDDGYRASSASACAN